MYSHYVPLHLYTQYSLLDGAVRIDDLIKICFSKADKIVISVMISPVLKPSQGPELQRLSRIKLLCLLLPWCCGI